MVKGSVYYSMIDLDPKRLYFRGDTMYYEHQYSVIPKYHTLRNLEDLIIMVGGPLGAPRLQLMDASAMIDLDSKTLFITIDPFTNVMVAIECESIEPISR